MPQSTRIGPYRVLRLINQGGQGGVYLGYDSRLQRQVAIKVHRLPEDRAGRRRVLREARLVASIQSAKVVQIYDLVVAADNVALIMEYVPGCDLEEFITAVSPSVASVLTVATDLAGALAAARQQHIVHGDLKARNVLVTDTGRVKLTDFGIARCDSDQTPGVREAGSPSCLSPKQYLGKPLDVRSDLFALGCLCYRMLTATQPFMRDEQLDPHSLLEEVPRPVAELVADLPNGLSELIDCLLQKDPADRPQDTQQLRFALRKIARTIPLSVSSTLLEEARFSFREEEPRDIPPVIPPDLRHGGHSRMQPFRLAKWSSWRGIFRRMTPVGMGVLVASGVILAIILQRQSFSGNTRIHIGTPELRVAADVLLPAEVSAGWLVRQVTEAASSQLGQITVTGPADTSGNRTLHALPPKYAAEEQLALSLRCGGDFCLFDLKREGTGGIVSEQAVLFSDMSISQWRQAVQGAAIALYD